MYVCILYPQKFVSRLKLENNLIIYCNTLPHYLLRAHKIKCEEIIFGVLRKVVKIIEVKLNRYICYSIDSIYSIKVK